MAESSNLEKPMQAEQDLVISRVINAPRSKVWKAWTDPEQVKRWWGPKIFTAPTIEIDLRIGGRFLGCMKDPDGKEYWSTGEYREIVPEEKIVSTDSFADKDGKVVPATYYGMSSDFPLEMLLTVKFEDEGDGTRITLRHNGMPTGTDMEMARQGWNESLDKLAEMLER